MDTVPKIVQRQAGAADKGKQQTKAQQKLASSGVISSELYRQAILAQSKPALMQARVAQIQTGLSIYQLAKPLLIGGLILVFIIGPGLAGILTIMKSMPWWLFVIMIFVFTAMWRNR